MRAAKNEKPAVRGGPDSSAQASVESRENYPPITDERKAALSYAESAQFWFDFGLKVIPIRPDTKATAVRWQPWVDGLSVKAIRDYWLRHPEHEIGAIVDATLLVADADNEQQRQRLIALEAAHGVKPNLTVRTAKGEHHWYRRTPGTYARQQSFSTKREPDKIDIKTGRTATEGRSMVVLPPSGGKAVAVCDVVRTDDLAEIDQSFIDALWKQNKLEPPRKAAVRPPALSAPPLGSTAQDAEILRWVSADCGYDDWLHVLMGLHDKYRGSDVGLALAMAWSATGADYCGDEELEYKWRSFTVGDGVTFATVARMAAEAGANLAAIAKKYGKDGRPLPSFDEVMEMARALSPDGDGVEDVVNAAACLSPVKKRRVHEAIKKATDIPLGTLAEQERADSDRKEAPDHLDLARGLVDEIGAENVLAAEGYVWRWNDTGVWLTMEDREVKQRVQINIEKRVAAVMKGTVDGVADVFKTEVFRPQQQFNTGPPECVNVLNGELTLDDGTGEWRLQPHQREHYRTAQVPVDWNPNATAPRFTQFLAEIFEGDTDAEQKARALLEMMGYTLMAHCRHERFVMLVGIGANGKSVLLIVLEALCGKANVAGVQPSEFSNRFQRAHLHRKLANIVSELRQGAVIDDEALKGITSGELTTVEHKNKDPFDMRPFSTCWFGTNHLPHTRDFSDALFRRALVVEFNRQFKPELGNCDTALKDKLLAELPGILRLALEAYAAALRHGFTMPASCVEAGRKWRLEADQVAQFIEDKCTIDPNGREPLMKMFNSYLAWASENGIKQTVGSKTFRDRLTALGHGKVRGHEARLVTGLRLEPYKW